MEVETSRRRFLAFFQKSSKSNPDANVSITDVFSVKNNAIWCVQIEKLSIFKQNIFSIKKSTFSIDILVWNIIIKLMTLCTCLRLTWTQMGAKHSPPHTYRHTHTDTHTHRDTQNTPPDQTLKSIIFDEYIRFQTYIYIISNSKCNKYHHWTIIFHIYYIWWKYSIKVIYLFNLKLKIL